MEEMDFQIIEAEDGEKALEASRRRLPDVIPLDWNMPIMDGYEFLGNLRRMPGGEAPTPKTALTISRAHSMPAFTNTS
jgi:two-component system chemotaxis response regulator CheY